jgi:hypothetical protein
MYNGRNAFAEKFIGVQWLSDTLKSSENPLREE